MTNIMNILYTYGSKIFRSKMSPRPGSPSEAWPTWPWPPTPGQRPGGGSQLVKHGGFPVNFHNANPPNLRGQ